MTTHSTPSKGSLASERLQGMNFLNEVAGRYPRAISFASGRPAEEFFHLEDWLGAIPRYVAERAAQLGSTRASVGKKLAQYGRTNGVVHDLIARQIEIDEGIVAEADRVVVTAGCQEAIALCMGALCRDERDVVLVRTPTYIGVTGAAATLGVELAPIVCPVFDDFPDAVAAEIGRLREQGKRPRAVYVIPDFDNPTGNVMSRASRERLVAVCAAEHVVVLEDNPYGMFRYEDERVPPIAALDRTGCTLYLGTYSKTLCPAVRVGFVVVPDALFGVRADAARLVDDLSTAKSFVTCNTSQLNQALVGGVLLAESCSLQRIVAPVRAHYAQNLARVTAALRATLTDAHESVRLHAPTGGFFLTVDLPFDFGDAEVKACAADHQVIVMPLSFFALTHHEDRAVRLAFSNVTGSDIDTGVARFADFVKARLRSGGVR